MMRYGHLYPWSLAVRPLLLLGILYSGLSNMRSWGESWPDLLQILGGTQFFFCSHFGGSEACLPFLGKLSHSIINHENI